MAIRLFNADDSQKVIALFTRVFSDSEGESEGALIGSLVASLIESTSPNELLGCVFETEEKIVGGIFFSRMRLSNKNTAYILSPLAVSTEYQKTGLGQGLIRAGIEHLTNKDTDFLFTYGDPAYYSKTGFVSINEDQVKAPCELQYPEGWLVLPLGGELQLLKGVTSRCVAALDRPDIW
ncbi:MAG: N-acetyltransferase [Agarilytica sp.]